MDRSKGPTGEHDSAWIPELSEATAVTYDALTVGVTLFEGVSDCEAGHVIAGLDASTMLKGNEQVAALLALSRTVQVTVVVLST